MGLGRARAETGQQTVILRKGGIAEEGRGFEAEHPRFLLFPTYFHQQLTGIREPFGGVLTQAMQARPPADRLVITSWAEVTGTFVVTSESELAALEPRHIYTHQVVLDRLNGRYGKALHAIEVAVHLLETPLDVPLLESYGGCRSWVPVDIPDRA